MEVYNLTKLNSLLVDLKIILYALNLMDYRHIDQFWLLISVCAYETFSFAYIIFHHKSIKYKNLVFFLKLYKISN
jgi:hypothetical protein